MKLNKLIVSYFCVVCPTIVQACSLIFASCFLTLSFTTEAETKQNIKLVYFTPSDKLPQYEFNNRIRRILKDIIEFYSTGTAAYGIQIENDVDKIFDFNIRKVRGNKPWKDYKNNQSAESLIRDVRSKVNFDFDNNVVLIFTGMCKRSNDEIKFNSPYLGTPWNAPRAGVAIVADCEMLKPDFSQTEAVVTYEEMNGKFTQNLAHFRKKYIGGIAHELGHALGIYHNNDVNPLGRNVALMGNGNLFYKSLESPAYLTKLSSEVLSSHPIFKKAPGEMHVKFPEFDLSSFNIERSQDVTTITGKLETLDLISSVYVYVKGTGGEHHTRGYVINIGESGRFYKAFENIDLNSKLSVSIMFKNGFQVFLIKDLVVRGNKEMERAISQLELVKNFLESGSPKISEPLIGNLSTRFSTASARSENKDAINKFLDLLRNVLDNQQSFALSEYSSGKVFLSDLKWVYASTGYGFPLRNFYLNSYLQPEFSTFEINNRTFKKGLYAHAPSRYVYDIGKKAKGLSISYGVKEGGKRDASVNFQIYGDGKIIFEDYGVTSGTIRTAEIDIKQVEQIELVTQPSGLNKAFNWSVWLDPKIF